MTAPWDPLPVTAPEEKECGYCGEPFVEGERAVFRLRGCVRRGEKSGQLMVMPDGYDPESAITLHEECELDFLISTVGGDRDEEEELRFCAGCGTNLTGD